MLQPGVLGDLQGVLEEILIELRPRLGQGKVATYIPALARVDPKKLGIAIRTVRGDEYALGDADEPFSVQSVSKIFALMLALSRHGENIWQRVGKEPSGDPFNSLVLLEHESGRPRNPFINAGALAVVDLLISGSKDAKGLIRDYVRVLAQDFSIDFDPEVARSELLTAHVNAALGYLMKSHGVVVHPIKKLLDVYCHQCALGMSCRQLARACLPLAAGGHSPILGESVLTPPQARRINALMLTCGMYDAVGSYAYRVGLPSKSGVGGGIVAVAPGHLVVAVWSPALDRHGNSLLGAAALELFSQMTHLSIF